MLAQKYSSSSDSTELTVSQLQDTVSVGRIILLAVRFPSDDSVELKSACVDRSPRPRLSSDAVLRCACAGITHRPVPIRIRIYILRIPISIEFAARFSFAELFISFIAHLNTNPKHEIYILSSADRAHASQASDTLPIRLNMYIVRSIARVSFAASSHTIKSPLRQHRHRHWHRSQHTSPLAMLERANFRTILKCAAFIAHHIGCKSPSFSN